MSPLAAVLCLLPAVAGVDPDFDGIAKQFKAEAFEKSKWIGHRDSGKEFRSTYHGGILVGFEAAVVSRYDNEWVVALRPVFRDANGTFAGDEIGSFDVRDHVDNGVKKNGIKTVDLIAKPGYAVEAVHAMSSGGLIHLSLTFARLTATGLDLNDTYKSAEIGRPAEGPFVGTTRTNGRLAVGFCGHANRSIVHAVTLLHLKEGGPPSGNEKPGGWSAGEARPNPTPSTKAESPLPLPIPAPKNSEPRPAPPPLPPELEVPKQLTDLLAPNGQQPPVASGPVEFQQAKAPKPPEPKESSFPSWAIAIGVGVLMTVGIVCFMLFAGSKPSARKPARRPVPVARPAEAPLPVARRVDG